MATTIRLKSVRVVTAVPFDGPSCMSLLHTAGKLEYDEENKLIIATPNKSSGITKALAIPLGNVAYFEIMDEALLAAQVAKPKPPSFPEPVKAKTVKDDTVVLGKR